MTTTSLTGIIDFSGWLKKLEWNQGSGWERVVKCRQGRVKCFTRQEHHHDDPRWMTLTSLRGQKPSLPILPTYHIYVSYICKSDFQMGKYHLATRSIRGKWKQYLIDKGIGILSSKQSFQQTMGWIPYGRVVIVRLVSRKDLVFTTSRR